MRFCRRVVDGPGEKTRNSDQVRMVKEGQLVDMSMSHRCCNNQCCCSMHGTNFACFFLRGPRSSKCVELVEADAMTGSL